MHCLCFFFFAPRDIFITTNENTYKHKQLLKFYREAGVYVLCYRDMTDLNLAVISKKSSIYKQKVLLK